MWLTTMPPMVCTSLYILLPTRRPSCSSPYDVISRILSVRECTNLHPSSTTVPVVQNNELILTYQ